MLHDAARAGMTREDAEALALPALGWTLQDEKRSQRLLTLSGLTPDQLRAGLDDPAVLGAVLEFLANHEPDLLAAADALGTRPETLIAAQKALQS